MTTSTSSSSGNQFALMEAQLILATILARYQLRLAPDVHVIPEPLVTLRPHGRLTMRLRRNNGGESVA